MCSYSKLLVETVDHSKAWLVPFLDPYISQLSADSLAKGLPQLGNSLQHAIFKFFVVFLGMVCVLPIGLSRPYFWTACLIFDCPFPFLFCSFFSLLHVYHLFIYLFIFKFGLVYFPWIIFLKLWKYLFDFFLTSLVSKMVTWNYIIVL